MKVALGIWLVAVSYVGISVVKESLLSPWFMVGHSGMPVTVYFSPTCSACKTEVLKLINDPSLVGHVALIPVAKNKEDMGRLARLATSTNILSDIPLLFEKGSLPKETAGWLLSWRLVLNKMALARTGSSMVPLIVASSLPELRSETIPFLLNSSSGTYPEASLGCEALWEQATTCE
jgi:hypothetical protein